MQGLLVQNSEITFRALAAPAHSHARARDGIAPARMPAAAVIALCRVVLFFALAIAATVAVGLFADAEQHPLVIVALTAWVLVAWAAITEIRSAPHRPGGRRGAR